MVFVQFLSPSMLELDISELSVKMNLSIITKNLAADPEMGVTVDLSFLTHMGFPSAACWTLDAKMMPVRSLSISKSVSIFSGIPASKAYVKPNF